MQICILSAEMVLATYCFIITIHNLCIYASYMRYCITFLP